ncbi:hypothetical protein A9985_07095 [Bacillus safensis]|uniref:hypothetical protein n=1 Tax=Bacillus TaxID=1386 RepID=UPI0007FB5966|nr:MULTISPECIES: hypothetical protein [Bacillus]MDH6561715.1 magnesium-transporting ATPase (P-type) [Bacillus sp. TBS-096]OBW52086.1 hypothetical protein A9985_07095 [Bacillus safensis]RAU59524.1 hypothetical protein BSAJGB5T_02105 [Bacillus safensis]
MTYKSLLSFFEKFIVLLPIIILNLSITTVKMFFNDHFESLIEILKNIIFPKEGTLVSIAAIFIGLYFTIFTLLRAFRLDSTIKILTEDNFLKLIKYIRNAFLLAFTYIFVTLFSSLLISYWIGIVVLLNLLLMMFLSAFRFLLIMYIIFSRDAKKYYELTEQEAVEKQKFETTINRLNLFLNDQDRIKATERSLRLDEELRKRNEEKTKDYR